MVQNCLPLKKIIRICAKHLVKCIIMHNMVKIDTVLFDILERGFYSPLHPGVKYFKYPASDKVKAKLYQNILQNEH